MPAYEKSVFINCPFDAQFEALFHAIVFTVAALGFIPRCARETEGEADPRMLRIARGLLSSKYSIHDLSRFQGEGAENLARFNVPLELGIALGIRYLGQEEKRVTGATHNWLALVPENFVHQKFISDLAGYDASDHTKRLSGSFSELQTGCRRRQISRRRAPSRRPFGMHIPNFAGCWMTRSNRLLEP